jgi:hypothetical protein
LIVTIDGPKPFAVIAIAIGAVFAALCLFLAPLKSAEYQDELIAVRHGTILLYEQTTTQVIIVADSKAIGGGRDGLCCKIINLSDDTLFFYTGNLFEGIEKGKVVFSQQVFARQAFSSFEKEPRTIQRLYQVAGKYAELVRPNMDSFLGKLSSAEANDSKGLAGFASLDEFNHPRLLLLLIPVMPTPDGKSAYAGEPTTLEPTLDEIYMGDYQPYVAVREFLFDETPQRRQARDKVKAHLPYVHQDDFEAYWLMAAVQASLDKNKSNPGIGGPVDAVIIESDVGIRWIKQKQQCRVSKSESKAHAGGSSKSE